MIANGTSRTFCCGADGTWTKRVRDWAGWSGKDRPRREKGPLATWWQRAMNAKDMLDSDVVQPQRDLYISETCLQ